MAEDYDLRTAGVQDAAAIVGIMRRWIAQTSWMPMLHDRDDMIRFWSGRLAMAHGTCVTSAGRVCGFSVVDGATLTALYVDTDHRGLGLGAKLIDRAKAGQPRIALWVFQANHGARRFYERHSFVECQRTDGDNEEGLPDVQMVWASAVSPMISDRSPHGGVPDL